MEHDCIQQENINKNKEDIGNLREITGSLKTSVDILNGSVNRLDVRINGTFDTIGKHIKEGVVYRELVNRHDEIIKNIREEKLNTQKNAQWRIALIVSVAMTIFSLAGNAIIRLIQMDWIIK